MEISTYSHPDSPVRHSYPLAEKEDGFSAALRLCLKTSPYILLRLGVLLGFTLAAVIWVALVGGIAALFSGKEGGGGIVLFILGICLPAGVFWWLKNYVLYLLKAGHIAVLTKLITEGALPANQVEYGKRVVTERFGQTNILFVIDSLVRGATRAFNGTLDWVAGLIPIPGLDGAMKVVNKIVDNATTYVDETIFSYNLARNDENVWRSSMDGVVYYAQNVKAVLKTAVVVTLLDYALTFAAFLVALIPAAAVSKMLPASVSSFAWILAIVLALAVRSAFLRPLFLTMVALTFHKESFQKEIHQGCAQTVEAASDKFRELQEKARNWVAKPAVTGGTTAPAAEVLPA